MSSRVLIIGAGHAGAEVAAQLTALGHDGHIQLIGDEPHPPYQRPPLSKGFLKGDVGMSELALRPPGFYADNAIDLRLGTMVRSLDRERSEVVLGDGERVAYEHLVLATGARPRRLSVPGANLPGVLELRTAADAAGIRRTLRAGGRLAILGGGYLGLEIAASARATGAQPVVIEREARVLARVASEFVSDFFERYHRARGVEILTNAEVTALEPGPGGSVGCVHLSDGRALDCDAALICVGAVPEAELAAAAGLRCPDGVAVDEDGRTDDRSIFAIGDVACRPLALYGCAARLESVPNALDQARRVAAAICGVARRPEEAPWFWSDQFDAKLQIAGLPLGASETVLRGSRNEGRFAVFHLAGDFVHCVEAVNAPREFVHGRRVIAGRFPVRRADLADADSPLEKLVRHVSRP